MKDTVGDYTFSGIDGHDAIRYRLEVKGDAPGYYFIEREHGLTQWSVFVENRLPSGAVDIECLAHCDSIAEAKARLIEFYQERRADYE